jgi:Bacterial protein of unknown function (DUF899)
VPPAKIKGYVTSTTEFASVILPKVVSQDEWLAARRELLSRKKEFDHERDRVTQTLRVHALDDPSCVAALQEAEPACDPDDVECV